MVAATKKCEVCTDHLICTHHFLQSANSYSSEFQHSRENNSVQMSVQKKTIAAMLLVWDLSCCVAKWLFKMHPLLWRKQCNVDQMQDICISQGIVVTFSRCDGPDQKVTQNFFVILYTKNHSIRLISDWVIQKTLRWTFLGTQYI